MFLFVVDVVLCCYFFVVEVGAGREYVDWCKILSDQFARFGKSLQSTTFTTRNSTSLCLV